MEGNSRRIGEREYTCPPEYPKFGFFFDTTIGKYAIADLESDNVTEPFLDDVKMSSLPLETWTANFIVGKIDNRYYLVDSLGNCYYESLKPFIICRNVFVSGDESFIVNKNLKKVEFDERLKTVDLEGYSFAFRKLPVNPLNEEGIIYGNDLIASDGSVDESLDSNFLGVSLSVFLSKLSQWQLFARSNYRRDIVFFVNKDFIINKKGYDEVKLIGSKSLSYSAYNCGGKIFSLKFMDEADNFFSFGEIEIVWYNDKTYFFTSSENQSKVDLYITFPKYNGKTITYRQGNEIIEMDETGKIVAQDKLSPKESYNFALLEELEKK